MRGQLGDGTKTTRLTPVDVVGLDRGVAAVAAGGDHTCALTTSGGVKCWGWNFRGRLGDGTTTNRLTPVDVPGLGSGVAAARAVALAVGWDHTCALTISGGVKCWGVNNYGQLGDGTTKDSFTPVVVLDLGDGVIALALGHGHTCALKASGGLKCWGRNESGQLGAGTTDHRSTPVDVVSLGDGVRTVTAGSAHTCALTASGELRCWGYNLYGQLGDGAPLYRSTPVDVVGLGSGTASVAAGFMHTCTLDAAGRVKCWGDNNHGQLGDGTYTSSSTPVDIPSLGSGAAGVAAGWAQTCALTASGGVKCWGVAPLGDGTTDESSTPVDIPGLYSGVTAVVSGDMHTCVLTAAGGIKCWGDNESGALGTGLGSSLTPVGVLGMNSGVTAVTTMGGHTCALTAAGGVKCWGGSWLGQSGTGTTEDSQTPVDVAGLSSGVVAVAAGGVHTCALTASGGVKCWGGNWLGQLGDGTTENRLTPVDVVGLGSGVAAISAGWDYTCALTASGGVKCWGNNIYGQLGDGTTTNHLTPVDVQGLGSGVTRVAAGSQHTCALTAAGTVKCWGDDEYGQLGDGRLLWSAVPVEVFGWAGEAF